MIRPGVEMKGSLVVISHRNGEMLRTNYRCTQVPIGILCHHRSVLQTQAIPKALHPLKRASLLVESVISWGIWRSHS